MGGTGGLATRLAAFLAALALVLQILAPPGYMPARTPHGLRLVICTGHGPMLPPGQQPALPHKWPGQAAGHVCAFAGHGPAVVAPLAARAPAVRIERIALAAPRLADLAPGRGLAAPPPPSHAPPAFLA